MMKKYWRVAIATVAFLAGSVYHAKAYSADMPKAETGLLSSSIFQLSCLTVVILVAALWLVDSYKKTSPKSSPTPTKKKKSAKK